MLPRSLIITYGANRRDYDCAELQRQLADLGVDQIDVREWYERGRTDWDRQADFAVVRKGGFPPSYENSPAGLMSEKQLRKQAWRV
jgi:hypothetical protein